MRSEISKKILSETSQETKNKVNDYANKLEIERFRVENALEQSLKSFEKEKPFLSKWIGLKVRIRLYLLNLINFKSRNLIGGVIASAEFKEIIKQAVKEGISEERGWDGEDEYSYATFDEDFATESVIKVLNKHLL
jgi:hypothetical protein